MNSEERRAYRDAIAATEAELGAPPRGVPELPRDCVMLTTIENRYRGQKGGVTLEVGKRSAAVHIVEATHRLATEEEIEAFLKEETRKRKEILRAERERKMHYMASPEPPEK